MNCTLGRLATVFLSLVAAGRFADAARTQMTTQSVDDTRAGTALQGCLTDDDGALA